MIQKKRKSGIGWLLIILLAFTAICWDLATSLNNTVVQGTFKYESEFETVVTDTAKVAIVPSDFQELPNQVSRTIDPGYAQIEDMVRKAVELQGGFDGVINKGDKVMLKPNLVEKNTASGVGTNTDVLVVKALIKVIADFTVNDVEITVAEGAPRVNYDDPNSVSSSWDASGYRALLTDPYLAGINLTLLNLNQTFDDIREVNLGSTKGTAARHNYKYMVHKAELETDVYISVPVLKIHHTGMTCALKNQIGTAPGCYYGYNKMAGTQYSEGLIHDEAQRRWTTEEIVDLSSIAHIDFVVVDAIMCLESNKTYNGSNQVRMNTIIAGKDPVAVDHVCTKLFCLNPDDIAHVTLAEKMGLGTNNPDKIIIYGASIDEVKKKVKKEQSHNGRFGQSNRTWLISQSFSGSDISTEFITNEATVIPKAGENGWSQPIYFFDDRIDLISYFGGLSNIVSYAFTFFYAPAAQEAELWLGTDESVWVYLNGVKVYSNSSALTFGETDLFNVIQKINIKEGENTLLVKTLQKSNDYSFAMNICEVESDINYAGNRVAGLKFYTESTGGISSLPEGNNVKTLPLKCYPNPVVNTANIEFEIFKTGRTTVDIYDINGRHIAKLVDGNLPEGKNEFKWNASNTNGLKVHPGTYFCVVRNSNNSNKIKFVVK